MNSNKSKFLSITTIFISCVLAAVSVSTANASHKTNAAPFDFAAKGANYSGYSSEGECVNVRKEACMPIVQQCGPNSLSVYVTKQVGLKIVRHMRDGQNLPVHTMTKGGHFKDKICTIGL
ncbi:MAG: hypothetical protein HRU29_15900 [Rhizobiales bacterium]|nr:hypothetical protein [Hyphomicrobiales bacterium]NRB15880.1 hypothetical protein [Hyphomicrobiales bacterium]